MRFRRVALLTAGIVGTCAIAAGCADADDGASAGSETTATIVVSESAVDDPAIPEQIEPTDGGGEIEVSPGAQRPTTPAPAETFTGDATVSLLFGPNGQRDLAAGEVRFAPGARTAWHTHPTGQTLIVTAGQGWVQRWDGDRRDMTAGDVVWIPAGVKHWHGATASDEMTHTALQSGVEWLEHVTDDQYAS